MQGKIEIERQKVVHIGLYSVEGVNRKQVMVYYRGKRRVETFDYRAEQTGYVESLAKQLLLEMVEEELARWTPENEAEDE